MKLFAMALAIVCGIAAALFVIGFALLSALKSFNHPCVLSLFSVVPQFE